MVSGRAMCRHLVSLGVPAQKIVRKQETGDYVADFFVPEMTEPVASGKVWAERIKAVMPHVRIIDTHDTIAAWRPGQPVIYATVIFHIPEETALDQISAQTEREAIEAEPEQDLVAPEPSKALLGEPYTIVQVNEDGFVYWEVQRAYHIIFPVKLPSVAASRAMAQAICDMLNREQGNNLKMIHELEVLNMERLNAESGPTS